MKGRSFIFTLLLLWALFNVILPNATGEENKPVYDLLTCIKSGLQNHPTLLQSQHMIKYYRHGVDLAKSKFGPHVSVSASTVEFGNKKTALTLITTPAGAVITQEARGTNYVTGITVSQPVFSSGSLLGLLGFYAPSVEREKNNLTSQKFTDLQLRGDVIFDIIDAYGKILKTLNSLKIEEESLKTSKLLYKTSLTKYNLDLINKSELLDAERILVNHQTKIVELRSTIEINLGTLENKVGGSVKISKISGDKAKFSSILSDEDSLPSVEKLYELAYQKRNDIKAQEAKIQSLVENMKFIKSKRYPEVNLGTGYFYKGDLNDPDSNKAYGWNVSLQLTMNLFDYGENKAEVSQQESLIQVQREILRALKNDAAYQVQESYQTIQTLKATLTANQKSIEKAKETLALTEGRYKQGLVSELEVMKAHDELAQYEQAFFETEIDIVIRRVALTKSIGSDVLAHNGL